MGKYTIKDLERISGIKAHTIRIWEQRYDILEPERTYTNIRTYSDEDLKRILNISLLNKNGYKISRISQMSDEEISQEVMAIAERNSDYSNQINALTISMIELDEQRFEKIIATNTLRIGFEKTMIHILYPFLQHIGLMWQTGAINPAQEHFISNLIRQKLIVAIDSYPNMAFPQHKKFLLFCPEGELHEIPLLFASYILRSRKFNVIYLGISVPVKDLKSVADIHHPDFIFGAVTTPPAHMKTQEYLDLLASVFRSYKILLTGQELVNHSYRYHANMRLFRNFNDILHFLEKFQGNMLTSYRSTPN
jgi:DNA-binding transcriptional MerR regulator